MANMNLCDTTCPCALSRVLHDHGDDDDGHSINKLILDVKSVELFALCCCLLSMHANGPHELQVVSIVKRHHHHHHLVIR